MVVWKDECSMRLSLSILLISLLFTVAGAMHLVFPEPYLKQMPSYLPAPWRLVIASGIFEMLGGIGVLFPRLRRISGIGLIALLVAVFPVNIHMYLTLASSQKWTWLGVALLIRLPLQFLLIYWIYRATFRARRLDSDCGQ